jgi:hypothetical protein
MVVDENIEHRWKCTHCNNQLNVEEVENRLLEEVDKVQVSFCLQDFRSPKTHLVSSRLATSLSLQCEPLEMSQTASQVESQLRLLLQVAELHQFEFLQEQLLDILQA